MGHVHLDAPVRPGIQEIGTQGREIGPALVDAPPDILEQRPAPNEVYRPAIVRVDEGQVPQLGALVEIRNAWRRDHPDVPIVLDGEDLNGMILTGIDFSGASLRGASLHAANLMNANLRGADLTGADLSDSQSPSRSSKGGHHFWKNRDLPASMP